jgi:hypothetical protein
LTPGRGQEAADGKYTLKKFFSLLMTPSGNSNVLYP